MTSITILGRLAATAVLTMGLAGAGIAQEHGEGGAPNPLDELKKALEQMRSAEELLAQSSRDEAAVEQNEVDKILRKLLDATELSQGGAASKMLLGAEKASLKIDDHIQKVIDMAKMSQGQGGSGMEPQGQQPPGGEKPKPDDQMRKKDESQGQKEQKPGETGKGEKEQKQTGEQPGSTQADRAYDAKSGKGRPPAPEEDPNAWIGSLPAKFQEDALKSAPASWPGKYENLIRRWQKTLARLPSRR